MLLKCSFISGVLLTQCIAALHGFPFTKTWAGTHNDALVNPLQSLVGEEVQVWPTSLIF